MLQYALCSAQDRRRQPLNRLGLRLIVILLGPAAGIWAAPPGQAIDVPSAPSVDARLSFPVSGRVAEILVKQGNRAAKGRPLIRLDDRVQRAEMELLQAQAMDTVRIEAAQAQLDNARLELEKVQMLHESSGAASDLELREAKLEVVIKELSLRLAQFEHRQDRRKYEQSKAMLELMELTSPADGVVEQLLVQEGESVNASTPVLRLANIDPLWVDVPAPLESAVGLKVGQKARVQVDPQTLESREGTIIHVASVANVGTLTVRVELPNPEQRPAGQRVWVTFGQAADRPEAPAPAGEQASNVQRQDKE